MDLPNSNNRSQGSRLTWLRQALLGHRSIGAKITRGYALALGIAVLGTTTGLTIGNYHQQQARQQTEHAHQDRESLSSLQTAILEVRSQQLELFPLLRQAGELKEEHQKLAGQVDVVLAKFAQFKAHTQVDSDTSQALALFVKTYDGSVEDYDHELDALLEQVEALTTKTNPDVLAARRLLFSFINSPVSIRLRLLSQEIIPFIDAAKRQEAVANTTLAQVERLCNEIVITSMLLSMLMAAGLAIFTSRTIARPVEAVTKVAQRVIDESNFDLEAPVLSQDEVGVLASAFNRLIHKVADYTQALELNQQTLEERVEARTQALRQTLQTLQQTQSQLLQSEKMSSLGQLVAGVAHEINNPVNFIHGNLVHANQYTQDLLDLLQLYQAQSTPANPVIQAKEDAIDLAFLQEDLPKLLSSMQIGADRIRDIVRSLRNFSRLDEAEVKAVDLHEGIDSTLMILQYRLKAKPDQPGVQVIKAYGALPAVECYAGQLNQVLMNILTNAIDALEECFLERTRLIQQTEAAAHVPVLTAPFAPTITIRTAQVSGDLVTIQIADNGPGMSASVQERLFNPFFTTKPVGKGTGMGMSISYQIITEKHRGSLTCRSVLGQGTEFTIELPLRQLP